MLIREVSELTGKPYPISLILKVVNMSSSGWYGKPRHKDNPQRRGRKPLVEDAALLVKIKETIDTVPFCGEGYKKVCRRLKRSGVNVGKARVQRLMRENDLMSPYRHRKAGKRKNEHKGTIITDKPNKMWATDGKKFWVADKGWCWLFPVIDHFNDEILAFNVSKTGNRFAAMDPIRTAVKNRFGTVEKGICDGIGLLLRLDHGSQYDSADFRKEMDFLGIEMSHAFVRSPECNGCVERFNRTIEEEVFSINTFVTLEEAERVIAKFIDDYNRGWILHRLHLQSPIEYRTQYEQEHPSDNTKPEDNVSHRKAV